MHNQGKWLNKINCLNIFKIINLEYDKSQMMEHSLF